MDDTIARWDDSQVAEGGLAPLEEGESLLVPVEFDLLVAVLGISCASHVNLDGVIDDKVDALVISMTDTAEIDEYVSASGDPQLVTEVRAVVEAIYESNRTGQAVSLTAS